MIRTLGTAVVTAILVSAFWIFYYGISGGPAAEQVGHARRARKSPSIPRRSRPSLWPRALTVGPAGLAIPVHGVKPSDLTDTFTQARAGGVRRHDAIDIMAAEGTPVVAAADGTVEKLFLSQGGGGITVYVRSHDQRWIYYYAHLQGYAPGLAEGQQVRRGQLIGRVGHTGNASAQGPHLHFAINRMEPGEKWWQGHGDQSLSAPCRQKARG